jgi:hypothetical protein
LLHRLADAREPEQLTVSVRVFTEEAS